MLYRLTDPRILEAYQDFRGALKESEILALEVLRQAEDRLAAAKQAGVFIPSLCNSELLEPYGACRLCLVEIEAGGRPRVRRYWELDARRPQAAHSEQDWVDLTRAALIDAVRKRNDVADVPVGVLLSGGLDSSLIVGLLAEQGQQGLNTFSVGFEAAGGEQGAAPILTAGEQGQATADPLPQALVLTAIVIGFAALFLSILAAIFVPGAQQWLGGRFDLVPFGIAVVVLGLVAGVLIIAFGGGALLALPSTNCGMNAINVSTALGFRRLVSIPWRTTWTPLACTTGARCV